MKIRMIAVAHLLWAALLAAVVHGAPSEDAPDAESTHSSYSRLRAAGHRQEQEEQDCTGPGCYPPCLVCGDPGLTLGSPATEFPITGGSCGEADEAGVGGVLSPGLCLIWQQYGPEFCGGCVSTQAPSPTVPPPPTVAPSASVSPSVSSSPSVSLSPSQTPPPPPPAAVFFFELRTDSWPGETKVELKERNRGQVVASYDSPPEGNKLYTTSVPLEDGVEYEICAEDTFGDGIIGGWVKVSSTDGFGNTVSLAEIAGNDYSYGPYCICFTTSGGQQCSEFPTIAPSSEPSSEPSTAPQFFFQLRTDSWPWEIKTELKERNSGNVVASYNPPPEGNKLYTTSVRLDDGVEYEICAEDTFGDGMSGGGWIKVLTTDDLGNTLTLAEIVGTDYSYGPYCVCFTTSGSRCLEPTSAPSSEPTSKPSASPTIPPTVSPLACTESWVQMGSDLDGEATFDQSGRSVSLSSDGNTVAVGAIYNAGNRYSTGHVRIYTYNGSSDQWLQLGSDLDGEEPFDQSGWSVSLSSDGRTVAIGAAYNDGNGFRSGHVRIYTYDDSSDQWLQLGSDLDGEASFDVSGHSVSLSSDGSTVAIGAPSNDGNGIRSGHVRVYIYDDSSANWLQLGSDLNGKSSWDESGYSVSLSSDGRTVAIGAIYRSGSSGHVRIYTYNDSSAGWLQLGSSDLNGEAPGDQSGWSVSLSSDGLTVAIGAPLNNGNGGDSGHVRIYAYNDSSANWLQLGSDLDGDSPQDQSGYSVSLSSDGHKVAIGAIYDDGNGKNAGHVRIYEYNGSSAIWVQLGSDLDGEAADNSFGFSVSLSSNGHTVAIGAPFNDGNGQNSGHVGVYNFMDCS